MCNATIHGGTTCISFTPANTDNPMANGVDERSAATNEAPTRLTAEANINRNTEWCRRPVECDDGKRRAKLVAKAGTMTAAPNAANCRTAMDFANKPATPQARTMPYSNHRGLHTNSRSRATKHTPTAAVISVSHTTETGGK